MNYRNLGKSGLKVSRICLGTNNFGGQINEEASVKIVNRALDCGINVLDTANVYTGGKSEEIIGNAVKGRRDEVISARALAPDFRVSDRNYRRGCGQSVSIYPNTQGKRD